MYAYFHIFKRQEFERLIQNFRNNSEIPNASNVRTVKPVKVTDLAHFVFAVSGNSWSLLIELTLIYNKIETQLCALFISKFPRITGNTLLLMFICLLI